MADDGTTYDRKGLNVHLTGERSQNAAHALPGYQPDVRPDAGWPGLSGAAGEVRARPEEMKRVAQWLDERSGAVQGLPGWLSQGTAVSFGPATWHEANHLREASSLVSAAVARFVGEIAGNMNQASASIQQAGGRYTGTENAGSAAFDAVGSSIPDVAPAGGGTPAAGGASGGGGGSW